MKKILSLVLVLAMILGMSVTSAFAAGEILTVTPANGYTSVIVGKTIELKATSTGVATTPTYKWESSDPTVATVAATGETVTVLGVKQGTATITCKLANVEPEVKKTVAVTVYEKTGYKLEDVASKLEQVLAVGDYSDALDPTLTRPSTTDPSAISISYSSNHPTIATVTSAGVVTGVAAGTATITATASISGESVATLAYTFTVSDYNLSYDVINGETYELDAETIKYDLESEIEQSITGTVSLTSLKLTPVSGTYGDLYYYATSTSTTGTKISSATSLISKDLEFVAKKGSLGDVVYSFEAGTGSATYKGTITFTVKPYEVIDEEVDAKFTHETFYLDVPGELYYMKEVASEAAFADSHTSTGMKKYDKYTFSVADHTVSGGKIKLYVVGLDEDGYAYSGTLTVLNADYDLIYIGEEDAETSFDGDDFEALYEDIFEETNSSNTAYVEFEDVTFTYSKNKNYVLYNDGTEMTTSKLKKVDADDIDEVSVEPLKSGKFYITANLSGKYYSSSTQKTGTARSYTVVICINSVAGDVSYNVMSRSNVYLDEDDFQEFVEDQKTSKALLNYILIDDADLNVTTQGSLKVLDARKYVAIDDDTKLYYDPSSTQYGINDVLFTVANSAVVGTKIYVPFTAYGSATGAANGKTALASGYIEFVVTGNDFVDVVSTDYFYEPVLWAVGKGITKGTNTAGTLFSPAQGCTRAQVVTFLYRAAGSPSVTTAMKSEVAKFTDVNSTKHKDFIDAIAWAKYYGITSGTSATTFGPDKTCTRAQIVTFIANYVSKVEKKSVTPIYTNQFTDVKPTTTHKSYAAAIQWAVEKGITKGTNAAGTLFSPDATCTRGQVVTFLYNYFK